MFIQHVIGAKLHMCRFFSAFCRCRCMILLLLLLPVVTVIIYMLQNASDIKGLHLNSHNLIQLHDLVNDALATPVLTDSSGEYRIVKWPYKPAQVSFGDTTLTTQCSTRRLHQFLDLRFAWDGPISLAVFIESSHSLFIVVNYLLKVQLCLPRALSEVSIQLVMPLSSSVDFGTDLVNVTCDNFLPAFDVHLAGMRNYDGTVDYPNNLLRNVAVDAAVSDYIFVVDIDMIPSYGLFSQFREFIGKQPDDKKIAYIVPVFEMQLKSEIPADRSALLQMWDYGIIQPFYREVCWKCQRYTDYDMWHNLTLKRVEQINIAYMVEWHDPWEPFFITDQKAPKYYEKFKNYGFNRISQVCKISIVDLCFIISVPAVLSKVGINNVQCRHQLQLLSLQPCCSCIASC